MILLAQLFYETLCRSFVRILYIQIGIAARPAVGAKSMKLSNSEIFRPGREMPWGQHATRGR